MDINSLPCYIYRAETDESEGELTTLGMLIPTENNILPNDIRYVYLLPMERKQLVYERVYNLLGDPPSDLMQCYRLFNKLVMTQQRLQTLSGPTLASIVILRNLMYLRHSSR